MLVKGNVTLEAPVYSPIRYTADSARPAQGPRWERKKENLSRCLVTERWYQRSKRLLMSPKKWKARRKGRCTRISRDHFTHIRTTHIHICTSTDTHLHSHSLLATYTRKYRNTHTQLHTHTHTHTHTHAHAHEQRTCMQTPLFTHSGRAPH